MTTFAYIASESGKKRQGTVDATSRAAAIAAVRELGLTPLSINESQTTSDKPTQSTTASVTFFSRNGITSKDITQVTRQLATLLEAGFPLPRALSFTERQAKNEALKKLLADLNQQIREGATFEQALSDYSRYFDGLYLSMIKSGETGGILPVMVDRLASMRESEEDLKAKLKSAFTYPVLMIIAMLGSIIVMLAFVVPRFASMFTELGQTLPGPTLILMGVGNFFQAWWWMMILIMIAVYVGLKWMRRTPWGNLLLDQWILKTPGLGEFSTHVGMIRFCRTVGTLLDSGVNLIPTLNAAKGVVGNQVIVDSVQASLADIREGKKIGLTLAATGVFPDLVCEMTKLGEETGKIGEMMIKAAEVYEKQTDETVKALTSIVEPMIILVMGGVVGFVIIAMLLPVFEMNMGV